MSDWDEAERCVERAHEFYERGKWEDALRELCAAIAINPYNASWHFNKGMMLDNLNRRKEAIEAYQQALKISPDDIETLASLGIDFIHERRHEEAIRQFARIENLDAAYEPCYCYRIIAFSELGAHERAEEMFYLARQYKEKCPRCFYHMGGSLIARGQYEKSLWCFKQVLELDPQYPQVHARIAEAYWARGQLSDARSHFIEELRASPPRPGSVETLINLGELLIEMKEDAAAGEKFRLVLEFEPEECTALFRLGELSARENDPETALLAFRRVIRNDKTFPAAHLRMAQIYNKRRENSEAIFHANCELAQTQVDEDSLFELGVLFQELRQNQNAQIAFNRLLAMNPKHAEARHLLAVALLQEGRMDEGIEQCRQVLQIQPKFMLAMSNLALAYLRKKDFTRARYFLREALDIAPEDPLLKRLQGKIRRRVAWEWLKNLPRKMFRKTEP
jgi:tetratricopeptide (TPR) repeat protein